MSEENIMLKKVLVEYLATKKDKYTQDISYFKIMDKHID